MHLDDDSREDPRCARRSAWEQCDRVGSVYPMGQLRVSRVYDWGQPVVHPRFEQYDPGRRVWFEVDRRTHAALARLPARDLELLLRTHWRGLRRAPEFDDVEAHARGLDSVLDEALSRGSLSIGNRTYSVSVSPTGNIRVRSAAGLHTYSRRALQDAILRGHF